ncbi:MAG: glycoside hydrolase family 3 C-terminal domain-containing protein [Bacteroidota bacterium]
MNKELIVLVSLLIVVFLLYNHTKAQSIKKEKEQFQPLSYEQADEIADSVLALMTLDEKIAYIGGDRSFFLRPIPRLNLSEVYMTDATQGVHIRGKFKDYDLTKYQLKKSTAFPCPLLLATTWNPELTYKFAEAVGEECRHGGIGILLGPGLNSYRHSQCGRNFEYFGEDPFLRARLIEKYVQGVQSTGTVATLKHFLANNTEYFRRKSNSIIDERTLHEIYLPPFKAGIDAGARAVMTSYNLLNGEWCGQSEYAINTILRKQLGFKWLVMTDWWSVYDGEKLARSGQDLEMPFTVALKDAHQLLQDGKVKIEDIDRMVKSILRTYFSMKFHDQKKLPPDDAMYENHELIALRSAREGIVLLKNENDILPLKNNSKTILVTGAYVKKIARGGGSAEVIGYHQRLMIDELRKEFSKRIVYVNNPSLEQIKSANVVLCNVGTQDSEGWDRLFELPEDQESKVQECVNNNPNTIVIVTSGSGIRMTDLNDKAKAIIYAWYVGQNGNTALAEILSGKINPSGKLPITIEKDFKDSPGYGYVPEGETLYKKWNDKSEKDHPVYDVRYTEGIFSGYRWYEKNNIEPLYPFGHGLSYTTFEYSDLKVSKDTFHDQDTIQVSFTVRNIGKHNGLEIAQLYVQDVECSVPRPVKELKGFKKVEIEAGQSMNVQIQLTMKDFSFWNPATKDWFAEKGRFNIFVGSSSQDIKLQRSIELQ